MFRFLKGLKGTKRASRRPARRPLQSPRSGKEGTEKGVGCLPFEGRVKSVCWQAGCEVQQQSSPEDSSRDLQPQQLEGGVTTVFVKVTISF